MSTDMQRYSVDNQSEAIALYALRRGLTIVRSYEDAGRSGLRIDGRHGLKSLINDVQSGRADFHFVIVYDVSRWGRFQDSDESAYYEFICKEAGISVEYCAEQFENDGSLTATILKNIKRAMAGEFSRELSAKVFAGQSRIAAMGFHVGSTPGYSLRRVLLDERGNRKQELAFGQRKSIQTDRVILVRGPSNEVETVHFVYDLFLDQRKSLNEIARILNVRNVLNVNGRPWTSISVRELLSNEKYVGNSIYNRTSKKLGVNWRRNPRSEWVRAVGAFEPVVSQHRFHAARKQLEENAAFYTDNEMLDALTAIWCCEGKLGKDIIDASRYAPATNTYKQHFGSLSKAYRRIGYMRLANRGNNLSLRNAICQDIAMQVAKLGGHVRILPGNCQVRINEELNVTIAIGRTTSSRGVNQWRFGYRAQRKPDILIVVRIDEKSCCIQDYFVLPFIFLPRGSWLTASGMNYTRLEPYRCTTLAPFFELCARTRLETC